MQCTYACQHNEVDGLALSQEDKPQTHSLRRKIVQRKVLLKVGEVVCGLSSWLSVRPSTSLMLARVPVSVDTAGQTKDASFGANHKKMNEDRPILSATKM